ncbi:transcriptional regulator GcvA [Noviherbaspirillum aridicola]|uniref:LysR family transcriptional regulator n=1 Tax=Noviherbaspirillum aridicola TaxID=2849687 RepID=A0ABQ4Q1B6_9BURK|nr:transcriptional regulator GcvA [Noviherbaspirillum aridicola]GIZ50893.1 LysR family transcriptional regulator [Noviherbaspirillum aridicola]
MQHRLPPLPAVRAFEAAARHGGFQHAAAELHVSAGAVAHQVKQLESWLGVALFQRLPRGVALTPAGRQYAQALQPLLAGLADVSEAVRLRADERVVTVTSVPSLVFRWLMPRLGRLREEVPEVDMRVLASLHPADFVREGVDVAIRLGTGPYPGLQAEPLIEENFSAVCSPDYRERMPPVRAPADLLAHQLLHDEVEMRIPEEINWPRWLRHFGVAYRGGTRPSFSHTYLTLEAAANGQGVALAAECFIAEDIARGRLVRLLPQQMTGPYRFHLLRLPEAEARPAVKAFCDWIRKEAGAGAPR